MMAASFRFLSGCVKSFAVHVYDFQIPKSVRCLNTSHKSHFNKFLDYRRAVIAGLCVTSGFTYAAWRSSSPSVDIVPSAYAASGPEPRPVAKPSRLVRSDTDNTGLKLTLYQYQSCPFCCKVRAYLDFNGFSYDVVEVNSLRRKELSFSKYKKVPILVNHKDKDTFLQLNDSSLIVSLLESYTKDKAQTIEKLVAFYPELESKNDKGKTVYEYPNKYFVMQGEQSGSTTTEQKEKDERHWRMWTDNVLVHMLSPNIYRTPGEAVQAFQHFSKVGEWTENFGRFEQLLIVYIGAAAMFFIGRVLKKRHHLKDDVRESLYDACREWTAAVRAGGGKFLGGERPCLADLAVYGVLSSIEGCNAFDDLLSNTDIGPWYQSVQRLLKKNAGRLERVDGDRLASVM